MTSSYDPDTGVWAASGAIASVNTLLAGVTFNPALNFNGSFTIDTSVSDGVAAAITGSKTMTGTPVNDAPSFTKGADQTIDEDSGAQTITGWATSISTGPLDENGQTVTFATTNTNNDLFEIQPLIDADGNLTYTPAANAYGTATVTVSLQDSGGTSNGGQDTSTEQTFTIMVNSINDAPELTETAATLSDGTEDTDYAIDDFDLLQGWTDLESDSLSVINLSADHGTVTIHGDGTYTIHPDTNYNGLVTLSYDVFDGTDSTSASLEFTLLPDVNDLPVLNTPLINQAVKFGTNLNYNASASFSDPNNNPLSYSATLENGDPLPAWMQISSGGVITGTPAFGDRGNYRLSVTATDTDDASTSAPMLVAVTVFNAGQLLVSTSGNDTLTGSAGIDTVTYADAPSAVTVSLANLAAQNTNHGTDTLSVIENLIGSSSNDNLTGSSGANVLDGKAGADQLAGGAGNDTYVIDDTLDTITEAKTGGTDGVLTWITLAGLATNVENLTLLGSDNVNANGNTSANTLTGNAGNNILDGKAGADKMLGGAGDDTYLVDTATDAITENTNEGTDSVQTTVTYTLPANVENLTLLSNLAISGTGNALANTLTGSTGNNTLSGLAGNDTLSGNGGTDILIGGLGVDQLTGGTGADTFRLGVVSEVIDSGVGAGSRDIIRDFNTLEVDKIDLSLIDAKAATSKNDAFVWNGTAVFTGVAGELHYFYDSINNVTIVEGTVNADMIADFQIELAGNITLTAASFVL